jgi:hypothetical protein
MAWKEFAGVTGSAQELEDPRTTAIMELYEELSFVSGNTVLLPSDIDAYPDGRALRLNVKRANRQYAFGLRTRTGSYSAVQPITLKGHHRTTVKILRPDGGKRRRYVLRRV